MKIDVYISKNNAAIHLGHAELLLRELIELETTVVDRNLKQPTLQKVLRVFASRGDTQKAVGQLRVRMRLRKPIMEALRFYREKSEIAGLTGPSMEERSRKKLITIQVESGHNLKTHYSGVTQIAPFFYYQFYTFDEKYSRTGLGHNPAFAEA